MKKLNTKGFTLIELLAVIVVLAIVMVIAVTSVLNSTRNASVNSFNSSALSVADFVKQQEQLYSLGTGNVETCYKTWREQNGGTTNSTFTNRSIRKTGEGEYNATSCFGLNDTDYNTTTSTIAFDGSTVTVKLCATTGANGGKFANVNSITGVTIDSNKCVTVTK